jgi:eukaryotic-like serine/threonine-protein kinase
MLPLQNTCDPGRLRQLADDRLDIAELSDLEQHLETCTWCRTELDRLAGSDRWLGSVRQNLGAAAIDPDEPTSAAALSLAFLTPSDWPDSLGRLGSYEVKGVLGSGGMGVVFKAFDPALNRNVAVKVLAPSLASCGASRRRFLREARAAAAVVHEHVVAVFAVVETAGLPFLVMEYVPGRSLQERLDKDGPLALPEVLRIGMQTAAGLAAAHVQGLVHRDVKPANILLENGVERVRLTDFGLARAIADAGMTQSGVVAGTPHYMAPEQSRGELTDHRADLFSLGSTLYSACAGHPPFRADTPLAVLRRVSDDEARPLRQIAPDVPAWLEAIIARLMAKDPTQRFQTAAEVADLLGRCLAHVQQPLHIPLPREWELAANPGTLGRRLKRSTAAIALAATIAIGTLAVVAAWNPHGPRTGDLPSPGAATESPWPLNSRPNVAESDELQSLLDQAAAEAIAAEAEIRGTHAASDEDSFSVQSEALLRQADSLGRDILTSRPTPAREPAIFRNPNPNPRRER